jgi:hypothetical protein
VSFCGSNNRIYGDLLSARLFLGLASDGSPTSMLPEMRAGISPGTFQPTTGNGRRDLRRRRGHGSISCAPGQPRSASRSLLWSVQEPRVARRSGSLDPFCEEMQEAVDEVLPDLVTASTRMNVNVVSLYRGNERFRVPGSPPKGAISCRHHRNLRAAARQTASSCASSSAQVVSWAGRALRGKSR